MLIMSSPKGIWEKVKATTYLKFSVGINNKEVATADLEDLGPEVRFWWSAFQEL